MQKLMRRNPAASGPPVFSVNPALSLPVYTVSVLSMGFCSVLPKIREMTCTNPATLRHSQPINQTRNCFSIAVRNLGAAKMPASGFRSCGCNSGENNVKPVPIRSSVISMERRNDRSVTAHRLWFTTHAGNSDNCSGDFGAEENKESDTDSVKARASRRQRSGTGGCGSALGSPDLLTIPGVGPRNLKKLVEKGFEGVSQLKQLYKDKFFGKSSGMMVEYLQSSVGIIHKNHAESITLFIKDSVDEDLKENDVKPFQKKRITLCVEGNISVGKTTFLRRIANETLELRDLVEIVPEPIDKWQDIGPGHYNILNAFYAEPERYAYTFQSYVFVTRFMQEKESAAGIKPLRLMERSVFSDRMVFVRAVHEAKWMNEMEICLYDSWFDPVVSNLPGLIPDGFIYLRASPDTCHKRMMLRKRSEEGGVSLDYLRDLHEKHESWLFPFQSGNHGVLSVTKLPHDVDWSLHPNIRDRVFYLDGDHMHSSIRKVPALVLDCEPNIDFSRDIEAKEAYARQVAEFFEFVKTTKEFLPSDNEEYAAKPNQRQVLQPQHRKLWLPGTQPIPDSALKSLDFRRAMSFLSRSY